MNLDIILNILYICRTGSLEKYNGVYKNKVNYRTGSLYILLDIKTIKEYYFNQYNGLYNIVQIV